MSLDLPGAYLAMRRQGTAEFTPECLEYLMQLILRLTYQGKGFRDLPAADLCRIFRARVAEDFGSFAEATLHRFGIRSGRDLGQAVFRLAEQGCLILKDGEREEYAAAGSFLPASGGIPG
jgi:uncharacterized repeat protein (TIGR04138 family)